MSYKLEPSIIRFQSNCSVNREYSKNKRLLKKPESGKGCPHCRSVETQKYENHQSGLCRNCDRVYGEFCLDVIEID